MRVWEPANGIDKSSSLAHPTTQKKFAPSRRANSSPKQLETGSTVPNAPRKKVRPKGLRRSARRNDFSLGQVDHQSDAAETPDQSLEEETHSLGVPRTKTIVKIKGADIKACGERAFGIDQGLLNNRVDGESKEHWTERVPLLHPARAGDGLVTGNIGTCEEVTVMTIATIDPRCQRREVSSDGLQNRRTIHGVESIGDVHRDGRLGRNQTMLVKPLPGGVNNGHTPIGCLDSKLNGLKDGSCPIRNKLNSYLASDAPESLTHRNGTESPIGLAKRHDGRSTYEWLVRIRNLPEEGDSPPL